MYKHYLKGTPQTQPLNEQQVPNSAGGYSYQITPLQEFERFLILGTMGGTYYVSEHDLTMHALSMLVEIFKTQPEKAVNLLRDISFKGRAAKVSPALVALAVALSIDESKPYAKKIFNDVVRTGSHLLEFAGYISAIPRGWGRMLRTLVKNWYGSLSPDAMAYQMFKYQNRNGWTQADLIRVNHIKFGGGSFDMEYIDNKQRNALLAYFTKGLDWSPCEIDEIELVEGMEALKAATSVEEVVDILSKYNISHDMVPSEWKTFPEVWEVLLPKLPATALIRNLANLSRYGVIGNGKHSNNKLVTNKLLDNDWLKKSRIHPITLYNAWKVYTSGSSRHGSWVPEGIIATALEQAMYNSFANVVPTGKRFVVAVDVSASMGWSSPAGFNGTCAEGAAFMAATLVRTEKNTHVVGFSHEIVPLNIKADMPLDRVMNILENVRMGATDCAQPFIYALDHGIKADVFVVLTDSVTYKGSVHPEEAMDDYASKMGITPKLIVVGMEANEFSIANPNRADMLDVVGFDTEVPNAISAFAEM